jgi:hypothetical protein
LLPLGSEPGLPSVLSDPVDLINLAQALDMKIVAAKKAMLDGDNVAICRRAETRIIGVAVNLAPPLSIIEFDGEITAL